jgi:hypothetical protein
MTSDDQQLRNANSVAQGQLAQDFSFVLLNTIESVKNDPVQFRNAIYELARERLQKEARLRDPPMTDLELQRMTLVLETAIERVETVSFARESLPLLAARISAQLIEHRSEVTASPAAPIVLSNPMPARGSAVAAARELVSLARVVGLPGPLKAALRLGGLAAAAAAIVLVVNWEFPSLNAPPAPVATSVAALAPIPLPPPAVHTGPVPAVYGIYAVSEGKLFELEPLMGRVLDPRIFMSAVITKPSHTVLPDGQVTFIVFRRDIASRAPDRVTVRVIARIARDLTFSKDGRPATVKVDDAWAIRNVSFDYQVAPSPDSREMIVIKPENNAFTLPPGRYGLVIDGLAYDFSVDGRVTEPAQCLERTEAANGIFYAECRRL